MTRSLDYITRMQCVIYTALSMPSLYPRESLAYQTKIMTSAHLVNIQALAVHCAVGMTTHGVIIDKCTPTLWSQSAPRPGLSLNEVPTGALRMS